ncbi:hypothetical protein IKG20_01595 [Candidatus Saccharibacteria bacterium]|nr:hypothetical protein [Candidatus Saccharibacteria bacterium]
MNEHDQPKSATPASTAENATPTNQSSPTIPTPPINLEPTPKHTSGAQSNATKLIIIAIIAIAACVGVYFGVKALIPSRANNDPNNNPNNDSYNNSGDNSNSDDVTPLQPRPNVTIKARDYSLDTLGLTYHVDDPEESKCCAQPYSLNVDLSSFDEAENIDDSSISIDFVFGKNFPSANYEDAKSKLVEHNNELYEGYVNEVEVIKDNGHELVVNHRYLDNVLQDIVVLMALPTNSPDTGYIEATITPYENGKTPIEDFLKTIALPILESIQYVGE